MNGVPVPGSGALSPRGLRWDELAAAWSWKHARSHVEVVVVGQDDAALARRDVLRLLQRAGAECADGARVAVVVGHTDRLRRVFENGYIVPRRQRPPAR